MAIAPDIWSEVAKVGISSQGGTDVQFHAITSSVDITFGEKGFDVIATLSGGRLVKFTPQEPTEITLEAYPVEAGTASLAAATTGTGFADLLATIDTTPLTGLIYPQDRTRTKYRVTVMWSDTSGNAEAQVVSPTNYALRVVAADGYFTKADPSFTDGELKWTVTFKTPPFDKSGAANVKVESVNSSSTATLAAVASYTSTIKY